MAAKDPVLLQRLARSLSNLESLERRLQTDSVAGGASSSSHVAKSPRAQPPF
eukprot:CAMPEP_0117609910 /NCGR_PEP_ID=MMETSP0784-20121206/81590_1 /TAXON_ID=39447 /ORGANISM="" /LENGTH=51 /DNA_ID=CAMNT_0005413275 /DNA_START=80 /DNA_END=232 /DNA_ORIENTATION=+